MISTVYLYYDNPRMLQFQIEIWNSYVGILKCLPEVLLIDDGSPKTSAVGIVQRCGCKLPIKVFRIKEDISWNCSGARNLGCLHSDDWIYMSDIDTLLYGEDAKQLFESTPLEPKHFYIPKRVRVLDLREQRPGRVNLLFHKQKYLEIGGYDEDYSGFYGREDTDFMSRLKRVALMIKRDDTLIRMVPQFIVPDAVTRGKIRDTSRNVELYQQKEAAGFINPVNPFRFSWDRVL